MSYIEPQWTRMTKLMSQIVQVFNMAGNQDLVIAYRISDTRTIVNVLLEAVNRRSGEMGREWTNEARNLVLSDSLFPALRETMSVLEEILNVEDSSLGKLPEMRQGNTDKLSHQNKLQVQISSNLQRPVKIDISLSF